MAAAAAASSASVKADTIDGIKFVDYKDESQLGYVMSLVGRDLSEPYSSTSPTFRSWMQPHCRMQIQSDSCISSLIVSFHISLLSKSIS